MEMPNFTDLVIAPAIAEYWNQLYPTRKPLLGETLFPSKKKLGLDLTWIRGYKNIGVSLKPAAFDAKAPLRDRVGFEKVETEMPFFREGIRIGEKDRQELLKLQEANEMYYEMLIQNIFDDRSQLIEGALIQAEKMRIQLLTTSKINIQGNGLAYTYDCDENGDFATNNKLTLSGTAMWTDVANSNPVSDILQAQIKMQQRYGVRLTRAVCSWSTFTNLMNNKVIRGDFNPLYGQNVLMTPDSLVAYFQAKLGLTLIVDSDFYTDDINGTGIPYFADGYFVLLPDGNLGSTFWGTTPEEADLMSGSEAQVAIVNGGIAVTTMREPHPVNVETIVSSIMLPSFETMQNTFVIKAY